MIKLIRCIQHWLLGQSLSCKSVAVWTWLGWQRVSYWWQSVSRWWVVAVWTWLVAERILLVGGLPGWAGRAYHTGGKVYPAGGWWPSGRGWWQSVSCCERSRVSVRVMQEATFWFVGSGDTRKINLILLVGGLLGYPSESCKKRPSDSSEAAVRGK